MKVAKWILATASQTILKYHSSNVGSEKIGKSRNVQFQWMLKMSLKIGTKQLPPSRSISTLNDTNMHRISHNGRYQPGEVLIHCDYSENYKNIHQNEIQSGYFGQSSFSLLTACIYYVVVEVKSESMVIISELPDHDHNNAFNCVKKVIEHMEQITFPTK